MAFLSGLTANGLLETLARLGGTPGMMPVPNGAPGAPAGGQGRLDRLRVAMDPQRLAISQALLAGDYGAVSRMTEPLRRQRLARRTEREDAPPPSSPGQVPPMTEAAGMTPPVSAWTFDHPGNAAPSPNASVGQGIQLAGLQSGEEEALTRQMMTQPEVLPSRGPLEVASDYALRAAQGEQIRQSKIIKGVNGFGYVPQKEDYNRFARALFAEGRNTPEDMEAIAHVILNRIRPRNSPREGRELGSTLEAVLSAPGQFSFWPNRSQPEGSPSWVLSADPGRMVPEDRRSWERAVKIAELALAERSEDPTEHAPFFFASQSYREGDPRTAPGEFYREGIANGSLIQSPYRSPYQPGGYPPTNYFFQYRGDQAPPKR